MEAYKIWSTLDLKGDAAQKMLQFAEATEKADKILKTTLVNFQGMNKEIKLLNPKLATLIRRFDSLNLISRKLDHNMISMDWNLSRMRSSLQNTGDVSISFASKLSAVDDRLLGMTAITRGASESFLQMGAASRASLKGVAAEATVASSAIRQLNNNVRRSGARRVVGNASSSSGNHIPFHSLSHVGLPGGKMSAIAGVSKFGGVGLGAALAGGMFIHAGYESSMEYDKLLDQLSALGLNQSQMETARAFTMQQSAGISSISRVQALVDAQMATRRFSDALILAPELAKVGYISKSLYSGLSEDQMKSAIRIAELRGGTNIGDIGKELQAVMHMYTVSGSTINPTDYLAFFRRYSQASKITPEALMALEPIMQELKPTTIGTALQTLTQRLMGGVKLTNRDADFFHDIGIFKNGKLDPKYASDLTSDPEKFFEKDWFPLLKRAGITSNEDIAEANVHLGNTPSRLATSIYKNMEKAQRSREQYHGLLSMDQLMAVAQGSQAGSALRLSQSFSSLATSFGEFAKPGTIRGMNMLANYVDHLTEILKAASKITLVPSKNDFNVVGHKIWNMITFQNVGKSAPIAQAESYNPLTISPRQYSSIAGHFPGAVAGPGANNAAQGDIYLDYHKVGKVIHKNLADSINRGGSVSSGSGVNVSLTPAPVNVNSLGGYN